MNGKLKILVTARYVKGTAYEGGSGRFMRCVTDTLGAMGHDVIATTDPNPNEEYDLIIVSHHEQFERIKSNPARKVYISHGLIGDEHFRPGANRYVSVSEETRRSNLALGIDSVVIGQPVKIYPKGTPGKHLEKILIIRKVDLEDDPFEFLSEKYDVRISDPEKPIEDQMKWADLCITLGLGALESMAQGKPVLVADNRPYMGPCGDGYVTKDNISEIALHNFSGRKYRNDLTREWIEGEIDKYDHGDSDFLHQYVKENHDAEMICSKYLYDPSFSFGVMINDPYRFNTVFRKSDLPGKLHYIINPKSATIGLNQLLDEIENDGSDIAVLAHQDMYFRNGWLEKVKAQLSTLPDSWVVAGIVGKDMQGRICGNIHDMRIVDHISTMDVHNFPEPAACFDECVLIINMKKGFRFDESLDGFDLYGTLCVLQTWEQGGTAWVINAFAEHYCMRPFTWFPGDDFKERYKALYDRFSEKFGDLDSTVFVSKPLFATSAK